MSSSQEKNIPRLDPTYCSFRLKLAPSPIHRWGIYAGEPIPANRKVIEYTGEKISRRETKRRADSRECVYLFTLDNYWSVDGAVGGSGAEYINHSCDPNLVTRIIKGDATSLSIAAASILAKVTRDRIMRRLAPQYPGYDFERNKGYPCPRHKAALQAWGPTSIHRRSWAFMDDLPWTGIPRALPDNGQGLLF